MVALQRSRWRVEIVSRADPALPSLSTVLVQNQGEMLKSGRLETPYKGIVDCATRTYADEGIVSCTFSSDP